MSPRNGIWEGVKLIGVGNGSVTGLLTTLYPGVDTRGGSGVGLRRGGGIGVSGLISSVWTSLSSVIGGGGTVYRLSDIGDWAPWDDGAGDVLPEVTTVDSEDIRRTLTVEEESFPSVCMLIAVFVVLRIRGPAGIPGLGRGRGLSGVLATASDEMAGELAVVGVGVDCSSPSVMGSMIATSVRYNVYK